MAYFLLQDVLGVAIQVGAVGCNVILQLGDALLLAGLLFVVVGLFLDEAVDGLACDGEGCWGGHFGGGEAFGESDLVAGEFEGIWLSTLTAVHEGLECLDDVCLVLFVVDLGGVGGVKS